MNCNRGCNTSHTCSSCSISVSTFRIDGRILQELEYRGSKREGLVAFDCDVNQTSKIDKRHVKRPVGQTGRKSWHHDRKSI